MASIPTPTLDENKHFSYHFLQALLNVLTEEQVENLLLQDSVTEKLPGFFKGKSTCSIYLDCVKKDIYER